jgi:hypothetical protein
MKKYEDLLVELNLRSLISLAATKIKSLFAGLKFGQKKSIKLSLSSMNEEVDLKSRLGYYSEYTTAYHLALNIQQAGGNLTTERSNPTVLKQQMDSKRSDLIKVKAPALELKRMETAGESMAKQIFNDMILNGEDFNTLQFDIHLTGDSEKGKSKADLVLTVGKMTKMEIVDRINASLKAYKSPSINLSNSTFVSFIKTLFYDSVDTKNTEAFMEKFAKDYGSSEDLRKLYSLQNIIKTKMTSGASKEAARKHAKTTHGAVIELIIKIFNTHYKKNKEQINSRMLKMMGFDGEDDFYAAIGKAGSQKVVSSRKSKEMQQMLADLKKGFTLTVERNGTTNNANILFKSLDGSVIINQANITFADTGGDNPQGKTNAFVNIGKYAGK